MHARLGAGREPAVNALSCADTTRQCGTRLNGWRRPTKQCGVAAETPITYQRLADFVIGKPGVMTINEALILGKPLILLKARGMGPVQEGNEKWAVERGLGVLIDGPCAVGAAVKHILASPRYREAAARHHHRGVFAVADRLISLLEEGRSFARGQSRTDTVASGAA